MVGIRTIGAREVERHPPSRTAWRPPASATADLALCAWSEGSGGRLRHGSGHWRGRQDPFLAQEWQIGANAAGARAR